MSASGDARAAIIAVAPPRRAPTDPALSLSTQSFLEDVIAELSRFSSFETLAARTSLALREDELEAGALAARFGVTHLLDSSVDGTADALQVKVSLIAIPAEKLSWSQRYVVPLRDVPTVHEDIASHVANHLSTRIDKERLALAKQRPVASLAVYDLWLRGRDCLRRGTLEADEEARELFTRALSIDPTYARGYAGLSLSHFNEWSCQLWQAWEKSERLAFEYACRAVALDDTDHVVHAVLGGIHTYRRNFAQARAHLDRATELCPSDAETLLQTALWYAFAGDHDRAVAMTEKARRLNPLHDVSHYVHASLPYLFAGRLEESLDLLEKAPRWALVDQAAYMASAYARLGRLEEAREHVRHFIEIFREKITFGREPNEGEPLAYLVHVNPFAQPSDLEAFVDGLRKAGLTGELRSAPEPYVSRRDVARGRFARQGELWSFDFAGSTGHVVDMKGCSDLALLLASPGERIHCVELAGRCREGDGGATMDARARAQCQARMRALREQLDEAERDSDLGRASAAREELDALTESLARALGLYGRERKLGDPAEKARTAVTWRIRSAIKKIGESHPALAKHLGASIRTGSFCVYDPEVPVVWAD